MTQSPHMLLRSLLVVLSLTGLADALYFTLAYYGRVKKARWVPEVLCAREGSSCVTVLESSYARILGVPNSLLGILYYGVLIIWGLGCPWPRFRGSAWVEFLVYACFSNLLILASLVAVGLGFHLVYALRRKLRVDCPLCYTAHAINAALLVLLIMLH